jgi:hypothetical protein
MSYVLRFARLVSLVSKLRDRAETCHRSPIGQVRVNDSTDNPRIHKLIREIDKPIAIA